MLVIGGSVLTDQLMPNEEPDGLLATLPVTHRYHYRSIGSLLFNTMRSKDAGIAPRSLGQLLFPGGNISLKVTSIHMGNGIRI